MVRLAQAHQRSVWLAAFVCYAANTPHETRLFHSQRWSQ